VHEAEAGDVSAEAAFESGVEVGAKLDLDLVELGGGERRAAEIGDDGVEGGDDLIG